MEVIESRVGMEGAAINDASTDRIGDIFCGYPYEQTITPQSPSVFYPHHIPSLETPSLIS
jgi:hypothetical protein